MLAEQEEKLKMIELKQKELHDEEQRLMQEEQV